jgi:outer membrane biosynthesis protein TonB
VAPLETPPGEDQTARPREAESTTTRVLRRGRFVDLEQHELITLLDEVDDERARARFRESIYIAVIVWLVVGWVIIYGPRYLWHPPVIINAPDDKHNNLTYLDTPPDLQKQLKRIKPTPNISQHDTEAQSPKPAPQAPQPRAGTPEPPAPKPTPQPQQQAPAQQPAPQPQQQARNTPPTPQPTQPRPQPPLADSPAPSTQPNRNIFGGQQSPGQAIQQAAKSARSGEGGDYGSAPRGQQGGAKQGVQIISDTQGVDFGKYLNRLLSDVRRNWLPLIPEECRPPLNKEGITGVRFTIQPDGKISAMHLDYSTHDDAINRAAWGSITGLGQAQPLPKEFHGPNLELRIEFRINKDAPDAQ